MCLSRRDASDHASQPCKHYKLICDCKVDAVREACAKTCELRGSGTAPTPTLASDPIPAPILVPGSSIFVDEPIQPCKHYKSIAKFEGVREACAKTCDVCCCADRPGQQCKNFKSIGYCKIGAIKEACRTAAASVSELLAASCTGKPVG